MTKEEQKLCLLCGSAEYHYAKHSLLKCKTCGVVLDKKIWDKSANIKQQEQWFECEQFVESFWVRLFQLLNNRRTWRRIKRYLPSNGKVLEIGVGNGALLCYLKNKKADVEGCDLSKAASNHIMQNYSITMHNCFVGEIPSDRKYDVVVMNHILEHVNDPVSFLSDVKAHLKENAIAHIVVPNIASWEAKLPGWAAYEPYHLSYFTPETLAKAIIEADLKVIHTGTHESFSGWFLALLRTLLKTYNQAPANRHLQRKANSVTWKGHIYRLAMVISGIVSMPLRYVQGKLGRGDEIVIICRV
jgi:2-polyprenyl-3-methyl-5-hydroxy-6-metoxy-1,4-benzoquinol methylase